MRDLYEFDELGLLINFAGGAAIAFYISVQVSYMIFYARTMSTLYIENHELFVNKKKLDLSKIKKIELIKHSKFMNPIFFYNIELNSPFEDEDSIRFQAKSSIIDLIKILLIAIRDSISFGDYKELELSDYMNDSPESSYSQLISLGVPINKFERLSRNYERF